MDFSYTIPANTFFAATKAEANALAREEAMKQAVRRRACCETPDAFGCVGQDFSESYTVIDGAPPFNWVLVSGSLPPGCQLSFSDDGRTMTISGTPTTPGNLLAVFEMTDGNGTVLTNTINFFIVGIVESTLPAASVGVAYSEQLTAVGGSGSYYFQLTQGVLPPGLSLSTTGLISGTPTTAGTATFQISLTDQAKESPVTGALRVQLQPAIAQGTGILSDHIFAIHDYLTIFANPPLANIPALGFELWNGSFYIKLLAPFLGFEHSPINSKFPNNMQGPLAYLIYHGSYWQLLVFAVQGIPGMPIDYPLLWAGNMLTSHTNPSGVYTWFMGPVTEPTLTIDQIL